jgi:hypothetical protein
VWRHSSPATRGRPTKGNLRFNWAASSVRHIVLLSEGWTEGWSLLCKKNNYFLNTEKCKLDAILQNILRNAMAQKDLFFIMMMIMITVSLM